MAERGEYRSISRSLLSGKDFRRLPERARWVFTVLKMNSGMVGLDTWYESELHHRLSEETGATIDQVKLALDILEHQDWIKREDNVLWVRGHLEHDPHMVSGNLKHRKSVQRHVAGLPHLPIVRAFVLQNSDWFPKTEAIGMGIGWVWNGIRKVKPKSKLPSDSHSIHDKEKENEEDNEKDGPSGAAPIEEIDSGNWPADASLLWTTLVAPLDYGAAGKFLKASVDLYGWCPVRDGLLKYIKATEGKARKLQWFADDANRWIKYGSMKTTDANGDLTEWGHIVAGSKSA